MVITPGKDDGQTHWHFRYEGEHRLTDVISEPRDRNKPRTKVSFRYDPLGRRISKTSQQLLQGRPSGNAVTTRFVWEGYRLLQEIHDGTLLTYVYSDSQSYEPLARIDGVESPEIYWFHNAANGMPELLTNSKRTKSLGRHQQPVGQAAALVQPADAGLRSEPAYAGPVPGPGLICLSKFEHRFSDGPWGVRHRRCRINRTALQSVSLL